VKVLRVIQVVAIAGIVVVRERDAAEAKTGYVRVLLRTEDPNAVAWWYVRDFRDGFVFARGGRCRTSKLARSLIYRATVQARVEHSEWVTQREERR
jgi:hypothetical protein